jgi:hypothetical protein
MDTRALVLDRMMSPAFRSATAMRWPPFAGVSSKRFCSCTGDRPFAMARGSMRLAQPTRAATKVISISVRAISGMGGSKWTLWVVKPRVPDPP